MNQNAKDNDRAWRCKFPGCSRYSDEDYCFRCEKLLASAKKASPILVARMVDVLRQTRRVLAPNHLSAHVEVEIRAVIDAFEKETG